jgi:palmitoyltransferase
MRLGFTTGSQPRFWHSNCFGWRSSVRKLRRVTGLSSSDQGQGLVEYQPLSKSEMGPHQEDLEEGGSSRSRNGGSCKTCINITKWLPVVFILAVIVWSYYAFVYQLCILTIQELWFQIFTLIVYHIVLCMFLWAYWQTVFSSSGRVPRKFRIPPSEMAMIDTATTEGEINQVLNEVVRRQQLQVVTRTNIDQVRYCEKCSIVKPDRAHHCSVCGHCILKMDHHCPWVNNCVSFDNYKFFVLFLFYALLYCVTIFAFTLRYFISFWSNEWPGSNDGKFHVLFVFFVAAMFAVSLCSLLSYHCFLISKNRSTLESFRSPVFRHGPDKKGFNLGAFNNFVEVFGDDKKKWILPVFSSLGDGISYPTRHSLNSLNGNYNSIDTTDSSAASGNSPQHDQNQFVEVKVEARTEPELIDNGTATPLAPNGFHNRERTPEAEGGTQLVMF